MPDVRNERQEKVKAERSEQRLALTFLQSANYHDPIMGTGEGLHLSGNGPLWGKWMGDLTSKDQHRVGRRGH